MSLTNHPSTTGDAVCADVPPAPSRPEHRVESLFPPPDADAETRRAWIAASPWPEVVFSAAH